MSPLTFGVEFEFNVAYIPRHVRTIDPTEKRCTRFTPNEDMLKEYYRNSPPIPAYYTKTYKDPADAAIDYVSADEQYLAQDAIMLHITQTLTKAGFPMDASDMIAEDVQYWGVDSDISIQAPVRLGVRTVPFYDFVGIEVRSPAYYFSKESLAEITRFCALMSSTYLINADGNKSVGLHVHIGQGTSGFSFTTLKNLVAFLWTFEPQMDSLHDASRLRSGYAMSMREESVLSNKARRINGGWTPTPGEGLSLILKTTEAVNLIRLTGSQSGPKFGTCNLEGPLKHARARARGANCLERNTIEFRQHAGTMTADRVTNWVTTLAGIVEYCRDVTTAELMALLEIQKLESWWKTGPPEVDLRREAEMGPILAEQRFTITHLLNHLGIHGPALYYSNKWHKHQRRGLERDTQELIVWKVDKSTASDDDEGKQTQLILKDVWLAFNNLEKFAPKFDWDCNDPLWPDRRERKRQDV